MNPPEPYEPHEPTESSSDIRAVGGAAQEAGVDERVEHALTARVAQLVEAAACSQVSRSPGIWAYPPRIASKAEPTSAYAQETIEIIDSPPWIGDAGGKQDTYL